MAQPNDSTLRTRLLQLGLPILLTASVALGCATTAPVDEQIDDAAISLSLGAKLASDPEIDRYRIDIDTLAGVVTLRGSVADSKQRTDAERIAKGTDGVTKVVNHLEIAADGPTATERFEDAWIVTNVTSKLTADPEVKARNIDVDAVNGVVTLSGVVETKVARAEAENLARSVDGVVEVVNELVLTPGA